MSDFPDPTPSPPTLADVSHTLPNGTVLPGCRADLLNIGDLWARGWSLIPLRPRDKRPAIKSWTEYQKRPAGYDQIEQWFAGNAGYNVGIVTGSVSEIFVVDCDSPAALTWAADHLPPCEMKVQTAKGLHLYFPFSGDQPMRNKARVTVGGQVLEIDIRATGGYVVGPGSVHPSGCIYLRKGRAW